MTLRLGVVGPRPAVLALGGAARYTRPATTRQEQRLSEPRGTPAEARPWPPQAGDRRRVAWQPALELAIILAWALWVGRGFLNFTPTVWPHGADYGLSIEPLYQWDLLGQCGTCVLWDGAINGGAPAFLETHAPFHHPLIILLTLLTDPIATSKIALVVSLALAGIAQWWLGRTLHVGWVPRLWSALLAVAGGHLTGRMELGLVWMIFSNATAALVLAPLLRLGREGRRRDGVITAALLASALLSGQGYAQIGLVIVCLLAAAIFALDHPIAVRPIWREFAFVAVLALLLTAVLWVPLLWNLPHLAKDTDTEMAGAQLVTQIPQDFLVSDIAYYAEPASGRLPFPGIYAHYIGWFPLALFGLAVLRLPRAGPKRTRLFLILPVIVIVLLSSTLVPDWIGRPVPALLGGVRYPTLMLGMAVPLILAAAAAQLDELLGWLGRAVSGLMVRDSDRFSLAAAAFVVVVWSSLPGPYRFSRHWMLSLDAPPGAAEVVDHMVTVETAWVQPPPEGYWWLLLVSRGQKITGVYRPWWLDGAPLPPASLLAESADENPSVAFEVVLNGVGILARPGASYASIQAEGTRVACSADAQGGRIRVTCPESPLGELVVLEHRAPGWRVTCNGQPAALTEGPWLAVSEIGGPVSCRFDYFTWDVPTGLALAMLGGWAALRRWRLHEETV